MILIDLKWFEMIQNDSKWFEMIWNDLKWFKTRNASPSATFARPAGCLLASLAAKKFQKSGGKKGALLMLYSYSRWYIILLFQGHVAMILMVFSCSGVILAMIELLGVVLACCLATIIADENKEKLRLRRINQQHLDLKVSDL